MDRFVAMQTFATVVRTGNFTKAAEALQVSRTTVTHLVQQLEAHLRVRLLHRTTRRLKLTEEGQAYFDRAVQLLADLDDAETSFSAIAAMPRGRVRLDVPSPIARLVLLPALPDFMSRYPGLQLQLGVSDRRTDLLAEGIDCVLRTGPLADSSLVARKVADLPVALCASSAYLERHGIPGHPDDLATSRHSVVGFHSAKTGRVLPITVQKAEQSISLAIRHPVVVDDGNAYLDAGLLGLGVICAPRYMVDPFLARGDLQTILPDWSTESLPVVVAFPSKRHMSAKVRVVVDWLTEVMGKLSDGAARAAARDPLAPLERDADLPVETRSC